MRELIKVLASLSLSGSLVILVLLACRALLRDHLPKRWQYFIWLVAVFRLLLPLSPAGSPVGTLFQEKENVPPPVVSYTAEIPGPSSAGKADGTPVPPGASEVMGEPASPGLSLPEPEALLVLLWLAVALFLLTRKVTSYQGFLRYLQAGCRAVEDPARLDLLAKTGERLGIRRPVELYENPLSASPLLLGLFRPRIVLPSAAVSEEDFRHIALHELTHCKRLDPAYKWLVQLTVCLHWFNPLVWVMAREIERSCELACDEAVLRILAPEERRSYGDTLLRALETGGGYRAAPGSVSLGESAELLKERLRGIMNFKKASKRTALLSLFLAAALITGAAAAGIYTGPDKRIASPVKGLALSPVSTQAAPAENLRSRAALLAEQCYEDSNIAGFSIAVSLLSPEEQEAWLKRCYEDREVAFFSTILSQAQELEAEITDGLLEQIYEEGLTAFFSVLVNNLDWEEKQLDAWIARAAKENAAFLSILLTAAGRDEELNSLKKELEAQLAEEYRAAGIIREGSTYYYQGKLVRIFLDTRPDASFVTLNMNPLGALDVKVERSPDGGIQTVREMTKAEVEALFGDMDDPEDRFNGTNVTVPIEREKLEGGKYWLLGEYVLSKGDWIQYDVTAETGERMSVGFCSLEQGPEDTAYYCVSNRRTDGTLRCAADFDFDGKAVKPGIYRLFLYAPEGDLGNIRGSAALSLSQGTPPDPSTAENPHLMTVEELPAAARKAMDQCAIRTWYVIHSEGRQYLYCNGFPWLYAWQPLWEDGSWRVNIQKLKKQDSGSLLLSFPDNAPLHATLDGEPLRTIEL
jgi:beta-lactamase regulating signal transducer with metallopeptidase domain